MPSASIRRPAAGSSQKTPSMRTSELEVRRHPVSRLENLADRHFAVLKRCEVAGTERQRVLWAQVLSGPVGVEVGDVQALDGLAHQRRVALRYDFDGLASGVPPGVLGRRWGRSGLCCTPPR